MTTGFRRSCARSGRGRPATEDPETMPCWWVGASSKKWSLGDRNFMYGLADEQALENLETQGPALFDLSVNSKRARPHPVERKPKGSASGRGAGLAAGKRPSPTINGSASRLPLDSPATRHVPSFLGKVDDLSGLGAKDGQKDRSRDVARTRPISPAKPLWRWPRAGRSPWWRPRTAVFALTLDEEGVARPGKIAAVRQGA